MSGTQISSGEKWMCCKPPYLLGSQVRNTFVHCCGQEEGKQNWVYCILSHSQSTSTKGLFTRRRTFAFRQSDWFPAQGIWYNIPWFPYWKAPLSKQIEKSYFSPVRLFKFILLPVIEWCYSVAKYKIKPTYTSLATVYKYELIYIRLDFVK